MRQRDTVVIGFFAYFSPGQVVCTEVDACVVSGSASAIAAYLAEIAPQGVTKAKVKKTRFGEILRGLGLGAAYAFDKESYARFYPLALEEGLSVAAADFDHQDRKGGRFFALRPALR